MEVPPELVDVFDRLDPQKRQRKLSNHDALRQCCYILKTGIPWRYAPITTCSYSTVYKRFLSWVDRGVFEQAWRELMALYSKRRLSTDPHWFKELFIDTTMIKNVGGVDGLGKNPTDRGRLATKLSVLVDNAMVPVSCEFFPANRNDCMTAIPTVKSICCPIRRDNRYTATIVGDKGYISKSIETDLRPMKLKLLTPYKKNARKPRAHSNAELGSLKQRHKVENLFCRLDKFRKIHCRHEKSLMSYRALTLLGMALIVTTPQSTYFNTLRKVKRLRTEPLTSV